MRLGNPPSRSLHTRPHPLRGVGIGVCVGLGIGLAAAQPDARLGSLTDPASWFGISAAHAQQPNRATQAMFLAVSKNDLPGVQAAINGGADILARDFNGMQAMDMAIERGYFDIAHYLISVRNQLEAQGDAAQPAPSPEQLAQAQNDPKALAARNPVPAPAQIPAPALPSGAPNPFEAPRASNGLAVVGDVREPTQPPAAPEAAPEPTPEAASAPNAADALDTQLAKPTATKSFFTTFTDFFKPPNTTGIVRKETRIGENGQDALTDEELQQQLDKIEAERGNALIKGPAVPISPEELARELPPAPILPDSSSPMDGGVLEPSTLPPYSVTTPGAPAPQRPQTTSAEAFGDLAVGNVSAADEQPVAGSQPVAKAATEAASLNDALVPNLPFGGGVDPDISKFLGMTPSQPKGDETAVAASDADPFAQPADTAAQSSDPFAPSAPVQDPFAAPPRKGPDSLAGVLQSIGEPQEVTTLQTHKPKLPGDTAPAQAPEGTPKGAPEGEADGQAAAATDPFATPPSGEVDELAGLFENIGEKVASKADGWDVKEVEGAALPNEMPVLPDIEPTGQPLDGVKLTLGADTTVGQPVGEDRIKMMAEETIHKPCLAKGGPQTVFCVDKINWPFDLEDVFLVDTIMYQGTRAIARYDAGHASHYHALFNSPAFTKVINYYIGRFGQPTEKLDRAIAPLAQPRSDNPTYLWRSREPGTDTITTLEVRQFDDARGGFPDTRRGAILLYRDHAGGIFPLLSQLELMVLKDSGVMDLAPKTPDSVW